MKVEIKKKLLWITIESNKEHNQLVKLFEHYGGVIVVPKKYTKPTTIIFKSFHIAVR